MAHLVEKFPIDLNSFKKEGLKLDPKKPQLSKEEKEALQVQYPAFARYDCLFHRHCLCSRCGAYDTVPEVCMLLALMEGDPSKYVPILWDEAGHRVATQYLLSALEGSLPPEHLLHYRAANSRLPGHPELGLTPGVKFSSGRLGHVWPLVNGVALANRDKAVFCLGSDGSQQEGNDAEAARLAVAQNLNVKIFIDDNNVTIAGHPSEYLKGFSVAKTLEGHGLKVITAQGEDFDNLWSAVAEAVNYNGPAAGPSTSIVIAAGAVFKWCYLVVSKRVMAPGIPDIEGTTHAHDVIPVVSATKYLEKRGLGKLAAIYNEIKPSPNPYLFLGSTKEVGANRVIFGEAVNMVLDTMSPEEAKAKVLVIDCRLDYLRIRHVFTRSSAISGGRRRCAATKGRQGGVECGRAIQRRQDLPGVALEVDARRPGQDSGGGKGHLKESSREIDYFQARYSGETLEELRNWNVGVTTTEANRSFS
ncbi:hypothetical protein NMY22_g15225 [Coprinellus aureogranulatus]|nr:hypothetical protein NMY22_g15225 [Coprinellus aureogranulatus]